MTFKIYDKFLTFTLITFSISFVGLVVYVFSNNTAYAQQPSNLHSYQNNTSNPNTLFVTGTANTRVKPDKVMLTIGVETNNKTADAALVANSKIMNKVIDALKTAGVKENETSTSSLSIFPNYNYSRPSDTVGKITGFTVSNLIQIQSMNIRNVSRWIDMAVAAGANTVNSVDFTLSDKRLDETKNSLIKQAIDNARTKADIATSVLGLKVVGVKSVNLNEFEIQPPPNPLAKESVVASASIANRSTPVISGEQQVNTNVGIVFSIR
ncbi:MAG: SIMPL domain-containing protein [Nitrososphaeraceae archaeon]|nr:SIMPL domain-containing protein [Nitrososphaeraceae archaeon]